MLRKINRTNVSLHLKTGHAASVGRSRRFVETHIIKTTRNQTTFLTASRMKHSIRFAATLAAVLAAAILSSTSIFVEAADKKTTKSRANRSERTLYYDGQDPYTKSYQETAPPVPIPSPTYNPTVHDDNEYSTDEENCNSIDGNSRDLRCEVNSGNIDGGKRGRRARDNDNVPTGSPSSFPSWYDYGGKRGRRVLDASGKKQSAAGVTRNLDYDGPDPATTSPSPTTFPQSPIPPTTSSPSSFPTGYDYDGDKYVYSSGDGGKRGRRARETSARKSGEYTRRLQHGGPNPYTVVDPQGHSNLPYGEYQVTPPPVPPSPVPPAPATATDSPTCYATDPDSPTCYPTFVPSGGKKAGY